MSRRHELDAHRKKLSEIRNIMNSMKTLAIMETHKLERRIENQSVLTVTIENIAADFLHFNPQVLPEVEPTASIILLIGSERGFCGNFNEQLIRQLQQLFTENIHTNTTMIAVGSKLQSLLDDPDQNIIFIEGASITEEIINVVDSLARRLAEYQQLASLYVLHHQVQNHEMIAEKLLPPFRKTLKEKTNRTSPPVLNLSCEDFFLDLTDHYLFNAIHRILYQSLMSENQYRIQHLEHATHHLDDKTEDLKHKINALRQEEIIEEIEVILLNESNI